MLFDTDFQTEIVDKEIKDGFVTIEEKEFFVDNAIPFMIKKEGLFGRFFGGFTPLYILKWNVIIPVGFQLTSGRMKLHEMINNLQDENLKEELSKTIKVRPEDAEKTVEIRTIESLDIKFPENDPEKKVISPELLKSTVDMRFLKNFKKYAGGESGGGMNKRKLLDILFIAGIGFFIFFAIGFSGLIKF
jgi:hypothetical protein